MGALKQRAEREIAHDHLRIAHKQTDSLDWKIYLNYAVYYLPGELMLEQRGVPEHVLQEMSFGERRLLHYLAGQEEGAGCCYISQQGELTGRFRALQKLVKWGIVNISHAEGNVIYFYLAPLFAKQKKFNIHDGTYLR